MYSPIRKEKVSCFSKPSQQQATLVQELCSTKRHIQIFVVYGFSFLAAALQINDAEFSEQSSPDRTKEIFCDAMEVLGLQPASAAATGRDPRDSYIPINPMEALGLLPDSSGPDRVYEPCSSKEVRVLGSQRISKPGESLSPRSPRV